MRGGKKDGKAKVDTGFGQSLPGNAFILIMNGWKSLKRAGKMREDAKRKPEQTLLEPEWTGVWLGLL